VNTLKLSPFALEQHDEEGKEVWLATALEIVENLEEGVTEIEVTFTEEEPVRGHLTQEILLRDRDLIVWRGVKGSIFTAREIRPSDAPLAGIYGFDLPVPVLAAIATGQIGTNMKLQAIVDEDDNMVLTLMLETDAGLFVRYDGLWHPFNEPELFDSTYMMEVHENAIQVYDAADVIGTQAPANVLPTDLNEIDATTLDPVERPLAASAIEIVLTIDTEEDLNSAIVAATDSPGMRWYVEKRATALGLEVEFPW